MVEDCPQSGGKKEHDEQEGTERRLRELTEGRGKPGGVPSVAVY